MQFDTIVAGESLSLSIQATDDFGLEGISVEWNDGSAQSVLELDSTSFNGTFEHIYQEPGILTVEFVTWDAGLQNAKGLAIIWVDERDDPPTADVTAPNTVIIYEWFTLSFSASDDHGIDRTIVDFGDGESPQEFVADQSNCPPTCFRGMGGNVNHFYRDAGEYRISIQVLDTGGQTITSWHVIDAVHPPPDGGN